MSRHFIVVFPLALLLLLGCASHPHDMIAPGIEVEKQPNTSGYYRDIQVRRIDGTLSVSGYVRRLYPPGNVKVEALTGKAELIAEQIAPVPRVPRYSHVRHTYFEAQLHDPQRQTSIVKLSHDCPGTE